MKICQQDTRFPGCRGLFFAKKKGFAFIELMTVIAIIGALATVIIVILSNSRATSQMRANQAEVRQLAPLFHQQFADNTSYAGLLVNAWVPNSYTCDTLPLSGAYVTEYRRICNSVMERLGSQATEYNWLVGDVTGTGQSFSIMVKISPAAGTEGNWFCLSSNGKSYEGAYDMNAPGCYNNP